MAAPSSDPAVAIEDALIALLKALDTKVGNRVFSQAPTRKPKPPYAIVWRAIATPVDEDCFDRTETIIQIELFATTATYILVKDVAGQYRTRLHERDDIAVAGHVVDRCRVEDITYTQTAPNYGATLSLSIETQPSP